MASTLAQQLSNLARQQKRPSKRIRGKHSLLFDQQAAADVDLLTIYKIGCDGLSELCRLDSRFEPFHQTLFSQATTTFQRDAQTPDVLKTMDESIEAFLTKLSNHFLAPSAFKALEYLIRKYRVNEFNVEALLLCALPYHGTNEFVRLVQTLVLENSKDGGWMWLGRMQDSGAAMPREVLVKRCVNDMPMLKFVCDGGKRLGQKKSFSRTYLSFYAVALCEVVASAQVTESLVEQLLPYIVEGLATSASTDYRAATLMLLAEMSSRAALAGSFLAAVAVSMLQGMEESSEHIRTVLLVLSHLASTQPHFQELPSSALQALLSVPTLVQELDALAKGRSRIQPLLKMLVGSLVAQLLAGAGATAAPILDLVHAGLLEQHAGAVAEQLLLGSTSLAAPAAGKSKKAKASSSGAEAAAAKVKEAVQKVLRALEGRHPLAVDAAINAAIGGARPDTQDPDGDATIKDAEAAAPAPTNKAVYDFVNDTFTGTAHAICGDSGQTVVSAFSSPQAGMRRAAVEQADALLASESLPAESRAQLQSYVLASLGDDDWEVVRAALLMAQLPHLPSAALLPAMQALLQRLAALFLRPTRVADTPSSATAAARQALALLPQLVNQVLSPSFPSSPFQDTAALALLDFALAPPHSLSLARAAIKAAKALGSSAGASAGVQALASALGSYEEAEVAAASPAEGKKELKLRQARAVQVGCVVALASAVAAQPEVLVAEVGRLADAALRTAQDSEQHLYARHLLLLCLNAALKKLQAPGGAGKGRGAAKSTAASAAAPAAASALQLLCRSELQASCSSAPSDALAGWKETAALLLDPCGIPNMEHTARAAFNLASVHAATLCYALHNALQAAPAPETSAAGAAGQLRGSFCEIATLLPAAAFHDHLRLLVTTALPQHHLQQSFLQQLYASSAVPPEAQAAALTLHAALGPSVNIHAAVGSTPVKPPKATPSKTPAKAQPAAAAASPDWLLYVLAAAGSPHAQVRLAAAGCLEALGGSMSVGTSALAAVKALAMGLGAWAALLAADADAAARLLGSCLVPGSAPDAAAATTAAAAATPSATGRKRKAAAEAATAAPEAAALPLTVSDPKSLASAIAAMLPHLAGCSDSDLAAAAAALAPLVPFVTSLTPTEHSVHLAQPATVLLQALRTAAPTLPQASAAALSTLSPLLVGLLAHPTLLALPGTGNETARHLASLLPAPPASPATLLPIRRAILAALAAHPALLPAIFAAAPDLQVSCFKSLVTAAAGDTCEECRQAARVVLEAADVSAEVLVPLLEAATAAAAAARPAAEAAAADTESKKKRAKKPQQEVKEVAAAGEEAAREQPLGLAIMALELLQWKVKIEGGDRLVTAAQDLLQALLPMVGSVVVAYDEAEDEGEDKQQGQGKQQASLAGYAAQLVLLGVRELVLRDSGAGAAAAAPGTVPPSAQKAGSGRGKGRGSAGLLSVLRPELAVKAAQLAPDSAVRNAALTLVATLAQLMPEAVLGHVLQVLSVIQLSAAVQDDQHSHQVCSTAMSALVPAWLGNGRQGAELWAQVIDALEQLVPHRRLPLLSALMQAMPQEAGLPVALVLLLKKASEAPTAPAAAAAPSKAVATAPILEQTEWIPQLASQLAMQLDLGSRLEALSLLLDKSLESPAHTAVPRMAVAFVTAQLKMKSVSAAAALLTPGIDSPAASALHQACEKVMQSALAQIQALTQPMEQEGAQASRVRKASKAALEGLYALLAALQTIMPSETYLKALASLSQQPSDKLCRRSLRLFTEKVRSLRVELETLTLSGVSPTKVQQRENVLAAAALLPYSMLRDQLNQAPQKKGPKGAAAAAKASAGAAHPELSSLAKQALLGAATAAAAAFGQVRPDEVLEGLPAVLQLASDPVAAVRGSALVLVAAAAKAVGARLVPMLPAVMQAVLTCGQAAVARLGEEAGKEGEAEEGEEGEEGEAARAGESAAVETATVLAALKSMVECLGAFLSPYLGQILTALLSPAVLGCEAVGCAAAAAALRAALPSVLPARLLLEPLFAQLPRAIDSGVASTTVLLDLLTATSEAMDTKTAATYHEQIFLFLLRVLDARVLGPPSLAGHIHTVEAVAVKSLVALVMKLTESRFKPLFLRMVDWASTGMDSTERTESWAGTDARVGRQIVLFRVAGALTERLRSVFVPYFRYLMDKAVRQLSDGGAAGTPAKKKSRKGAEAAEGAEGEAGVEARWLLSLGVVRTLHRTLMYDSVAFLDSEKLGKLLQPLVSQLEAQPPAAVAAALSQQCADPDLDSYLTASSKVKHAAFDTMGSAVVACLVQMGITANSDVFWKPLNHAVLMLTRSSSVRTRLLALEVVAQLVARLREEFLVLLPETLPFLAELLEDPDSAVEARTQRLVALLEDISGEKLDQYLA